MSETNSWEQRYREGRTGWQRESVSPALLTWLADGTLKPGRIMIPGAGRSHEPRHLAEAGFDVTTVDIAPTAVAFQHEALAATGGSVIEGDLLSYAPAEPFDAIYEQSCLCALPPEIVPAYAAQIARWLRPGGVLLALFVQRTGEGGPPFNCPLPAMRQLFPETAWRWPQQSWPDIRHDSGAFEGLYEVPQALTRL